MVFVDAGLLGGGLHCAPSVARQQHDVHARCEQGGDGVGCVRLQLIGQGKCAHGLAAEREVDHAAPIVVRGKAIEDADIDAAFHQQAPASEHAILSTNSCAHAQAAQCRKTFRRHRVAVRALCLHVARQGGGERVFAMRFDCRYAVQRPCAIHRFGPGDILHFGLARGQRAGLVDAEHVDCFQRLQGRCILDQNTCAGAAPHAQHDGNRRRQAQRARASHDQHRNRRGQAVSQGRSRAEPAPGEKAGKRAQHHGGHEPGRDAVGEMLNRCTRAACLGDHRHNLRQERISANLVGAQQQRAVLIHRAGGNPHARFLGDWHGFAREHGFVNLRLAFGHCAIDRNAATRFDAQDIAGHHQIKCDFLFAPIGADAPGVLRRQLHQGANCRIRAFARLQFQHLTEQDQGNDHGGSLEIQRRHALGLEVCRQQIRGKPGQQAEQPGRHRAQADQAEHIQVTCFERGQCALQEWPAGPQHHRRGQHGLQSIEESHAQAFMQMQERRHVTHGQQE